MGIASAFRMSQSVGTPNLCRLLHNDLLQIIGPRSSKTTADRPHKELQPVVTTLCCISVWMHQNTVLTGRTKMAPLGSVRRCAVKQEKREREKHVQQPEVAPIEEDTITAETVTVDEDFQAALEVVTIDDSSQTAMDEIMNDRLVSVLVIGYAFTESYPNAMDDALLHTQVSACMPWGIHAEPMTMVTGEWCNGRPLGYPVPPVTNVTATDAVLMSVQQHLQPKARHLAALLLRTHFEHRWCIASFT